MMEKLCDKCQQIVDTTVDYRDHSDTSFTVLATVPFHTGEELMKSTKTGCCMCLNVYRQREQWNYGADAGIREDATILCDLLSGPLKLRFKLASDSWGSLVAAELVVSLEDGEQLNSFYCASSSSALADHSDGKVDVQQLSPSTDSSQTFATIRRWLTECAGHEACQAWAAATFLEGEGPARLLQLFDDECGTRCKLVKRSDYMQREGVALAVLPRYSALSYCWGGKLPLRLTHDTIFALETGIAWSDLPLTFQHAIQTTRKLGLDNIWIDALCIVQDSPEDFREQAALMGHIYAKCYINLHAISARDSTVGFLGARETTLIQPFIVASSGDDKSLSSKLVCHYDNSFEDVNGGVLATRAWVVQERFLSPRKLYFAASQVHWSCMSITSSEVAATIQGYTGSSSMERGRVETSDQTALLHAPDHGNTQALYALWDSTLTDYTSTFLTFASDRPVAIQGLARIFCNRVGLEREDAYVNGIWRDRFVDGLLWRSAYPGGSDRDDGLGDCSWSWMCFNDWILSKYDPLTSEEGVTKKSIVWCDVIELDGNCTLTESDPSPSGWVRLRGPLCRATAVMVKYDAVQHESRRGQLLIGDDALESGRDYELILDKRRYLKKTEADDGHFEVYLLLCRSVVSRSDTTSHGTVHFAEGPGQYRGSVFCGTSYECLVLLPIADKPAYFRRVGYVAFQPYMPGNSSQEITQVTEADLMRIYTVLNHGFSAHNVPEELYESIDSSGHCTIVLT